MTIKEAIDRLKKLETAYGGDIVVYFDCPICKQAFEPKIIETAAIHFGAKEAK